MGGRARNRRGRQADPESDVDVLQVQISDLRKQLQQTVDVVEDKETIIQDLRDSLEETGAAEVRAVAKTRDLEAELDTMVKRVEHIEAQAEASRRQAAHRHDEMSQEHSRAMAQLAAQREKESNRAASAEGAYGDLKEHCRTLEAMIQANQLELDIKLWP